MTRLRLRPAGGSYVAVYLPAVGCGDGWQALESTLKLSGWSQERRVILVREAPSLAPVSGPVIELDADAVVPAGKAGKTMKKQKKRRGKDRQSDLPHATGEGWDAKATPWSGKIAVLVTSLDKEAWPTIIFPKQYRDRGDGENCYDELKNQWGWGGYTSRKLAPCRLMANLIALFYNWWNLYLRFYDAEHHREAIRSRPMLMSGVGRQVQVAGSAPSRSAFCMKKERILPVPFR